MIYGPFSSRRLGLSLGIDILPAVTKICTYNCSYCEIGFTFLEGYSDINERVTFPDSFLEYLDENLPTILQKETELDSITLGYNGEPTLSRNLREIIIKIKEIRDDSDLNIPISIFSNSSTIHDDDICSSLSLVNKVYAKVDSGLQKTFQKVNEPFPSVPSISEIIAGLRKFKMNYPGNTLIIQTMLIDGEIGNIEDVNIESLAHAYDEINPDKVDLYTLSQRPANFLAKPVSEEKLHIIEEKIYSIAKRNFRNKIEIFPFR